MAFSKVQMDLEDTSVECEFLKDIPVLSQNQRSLDDQLRLLHLAAIRLGLYDADDWLIQMTTPGDD